MAPEAAPREHVWISDEGIAILRRVQQAILDEPKRLDMTTWGIRPDDPRAARWDMKFPACNTIGCIAGWTVLSSTDAAKLRIMSDDEFRHKFPVYDMPRIARNLLGISHDAANRLFYVESWPIDSMRIYAANATTIEGRASATVYRIDRFIDTGE